MADSYIANNYHHGYRDNDHYGNGAGGTTYFQIDGTSCGNGAGGGFADGHGDGYDYTYYHDCGWGHGKFAISTTKFITRRR